jgi:3-deoxy-manno-octulosonate cytidylyltransferase (CMP-KDO synthetase)
MPHTAIIVPCRLESTRFPRKLLHIIQGRPLLLWVAERIREQTPEYPMYLAVDHDLLYDCATAAGFVAIRTRPDHPSGTDRIAEANRQVGAECVINVQADEPLVSARQIRLLAELIAGPAEMATLAAPFQTAADFRNPNQVKVVCDRAGRALYFSRSPIPYGREAAGQVDEAWLRANPCHKHLGLYAYKAALLQRIALLPVGRLEQLEKLEQLRVLENGHAIAVGITEDPTIGVDTPEDAVKFEAWLARGRP